MNREPHSPVGDGRPPAVDHELIKALTGLDANSSLAVAHRTRRSIREAGTRLRGEAQRRRRHKGFALLLVMGFLMLLTPALWSGVDEILAGEHISDLSTMFTLLALMLFSAVVAALIASWKGHQPLRYGRRNF
jgi:hypothetical protein